MRRQHKARNSGSDLTQTKDVAADAARCGKHRRERHLPAAAVGDFTHPIDAMAADGDAL
jgi:hypothetical protein